MPSVDRDLYHLHPEFRAKVKALENDVKAECASKVGPLSGLEIITLETWRPNSRSDELYAQGRTKPGPVVTNARGGYSFHNYGLAIDKGIKYRDKEFSWNWPADPRLMNGMRRVAVLAAKHGIEWGGYWPHFKDLPHFQDAAAPSLATLRKQYPHGWCPEDPA